VKTYSREDWERAQVEWEGFSSEWRDARHQAAMRGILFPPSGGPFDSWGDDEPSQRAILIRAIRETPKLLAVAISRSQSWAQVVRIVLVTYNEGAEESRLQDERENRRKVLEEADGREATMALKQIMTRIENS
jgi:hypothetical protein